MNSTAWIARILLGVSLVSLTALLLKPPAKALLTPAEARGDSLPSLEPIGRIVTDGRPDEALRQLATLVRRYPALADRGGPLDGAPALRDLVLRDWKQAVDKAPDRAAAIKDARFLQRRLAGGCS